MSGSRYTSRDGFSGRSIQYGRRVPSGECCVPVRVRKAEPGDRYGDISVDVAKSREVYREWMAKTRPAHTAKLPIR